MNVTGQCGQKNLELTATPCGQIYNYSTVVAIAPVCKPVTKRPHVLEIEMSPNQKYFFIVRGGKVMIVSNQKVILLGWAGYNVK